MQQASKQASKQASSREGRLKGPELIQSIDKVAKGFVFCKVGESLCVVVECVCLLLLFVVFCAEAVQWYGVGVVSVSRASGKGEKARLKGAGCCVSDGAHEK